MWFNSILFYTFFVLKFLALPTNSQDWIINFRFNIKEEIYIKEEPLFMDIGESNAIKSELNNRVVDEQTTENHNQNPLTTRPLKCLHCSLWLLPSNLTRHLKRFHHSNNCKLCPFTCRSRKVFIRHLSTHAPQKSPSGPKGYKCDLCESVIKGKLNFRKHLAAEHLRGRKPFVCEVCNEDFDIKLLLVRHKELHQQKNQCSLCNRAFDCSSKLKYHMNNHRKPLECSVCQRKFAYQAALSQHLLTHTENNL